MSRIVLEVSNEEHQKIKALAALQGLSIKDYVLGKVFPGDDDEGKAMKDLQALLSERVVNADGKSQTGKTFTQIANEAIKNRHDS